LLRINPIAAGEHYVGELVVDAHSWSRDASWLISPVIAAAAFGVAAVVAARWVRLRGAASG
jgi:ABC-2 type transport system permease protein